VVLEPLRSLALKPSLHLPPDFLADQLFWDVRIAGAGCGGTAGGRNRRGFRLASGSAFDHPAIQCLPAYGIFIIPNRTVSFHPHRGCLTLQRYYLAWNTNATCGRNQLPVLVATVADDEQQFESGYLLLAGSLRCRRALLQLANDPRSWLERSLAAPHQLVAVATPVPVPAMLLLVTLLIQPLNLLQQPCASALVS